MQDLRVQGLGIKGLAFIGVEDLGLLCLRVPINEGESSDIFARCLAA